MIKRDRASWIQTAIAAAIALIVGVFIGWAIGNDDDADDAGVGQPVSVDSGDVPEVCIEAIREAREELGIRSQAVDIARRYPDLAQRAADAVRDLEPGQFQSFLRDFEDANADLEAALDELGRNDFSTPAQACEDAADAS